jgi:hypothetical protein
MVPQDILRTETGALIENVEQTDDRDRAVQELCQGDRCACLSPPPCLFSSSSSSSFDVRSWRCQVMNKTDMNAGAIDRMFIRANQDRSEGVDQFDRANMGKVS